MENRIGMAYKALKVKDFANAMAEWLLDTAMVALAIAVVAAVAALFSKEAAYWAWVLARASFSFFVGMLMFHIISAVSTYAIKLCGWSEVELEGMKGMNAR